MNEGDELRTGSYCGIDLSRLSRTEIIKNGAKFTGDPPPNSFSLLNDLCFHSEQCAFNITMVANTETFDIVRQRTEPNTLP